MSESLRIILMVCLLIAVYILTRRVNLWRVKRAYTFILKDLEGRGAVDAASAVSLAYAKVSIFRAGIKDFRPKALEFLVANSIVGRTEDGLYYLKDKKVRLGPSG